MGTRWGGRGGRACCRGDGAGAVRGRGCRGAGPDYGGEDFSAYQRVAPTAFFLVGTQNEEKGITHPSFDIDEDTLPIGVKMFVHAAMRLLGAESRTRTEAKGG